MERSSRWRWIAVGISAASWLVLAAVFWGARSAIEEALAEQTTEPVRNLISGAVIGVAILIGSGWAYTVRALGRRMRLRDEADLVTPDKVAVLYLRSFHVDVTGFGTWGISSPSVEERLVSVLSQLGQVGAVGAPGERLPPLGAVRIYAEGEDWRDLVIRLMRRARALVIIAGNTPSLEWEIEVAALLVEPRRVLLVLPSLPAGAAGDEQYRRFATTAGNLFPRGIPARRDDAGWLMFDADWTPRPIATPSWKRLLGQGRLSRVGITEALRPFFERLGHEAPRTRTRLVAIFVPAFLLFILVGVLTAAQWAGTELWYGIYSVFRASRITSENGTFAATLPPRWIRAPSHMAARLPLARASDRLIVVHLAGEATAMGIVERFEGAAARDPARRFVGEARSTFARDGARTG
ncbi:MAG TPA: hypothetical protein VJ276_11910 [Thermoanaerobaculia bacterium]|nr:hypothetical protein [Thermoanaerobaculia bacterium]